MIRSRRVAAVGVLAATLCLTPARAFADPSSPATAKLEAGQASAVATPDQDLGKSWRTSSDVLVTGSGDTDGYHLLIAREKDAFAFRTLATLTSPSIDVGPWMGEVCVTGSGRYAVAVFAPKKATNKPALMMAGGLAAVVDTTTGKATHVATGVQLAYFNPSCGPGDTALLTRSTGTDLNPGTDLLTVDAALGRVTGTRHIDGPIALPTPALDGDYAVSGDRLVKVDADGDLTKVAKLTGQPFGLRPAPSAGVDLVSVQGKQAVAERFAGGRLVTTATGAADNLQLFPQRGGGNVLVGQVTMRTAVSKLTAIPAAARVETVSAEGHLLAEQVYSRQAAMSVAEPLAMADPADAGSVAIKVQAVASGRETASSVAVQSAPVLSVDLNAAPGKGLATKSLAAPPSVLVPTCAVPRNDPKVQALQPSADQVEWAVDQAVHGRLTTTRPANYLKSGLGSYQPQVMFKKKDLIGGGTVPANVLLGIVAQESNMSQASWHAVPGDTGNPLIGSYYGNNGNLDYINYDKADCGYGIGQVTDGMRVGTGNATEQRVIAIDYAANIAASLNILIEKWNQLAAEPNQYQSFMNDNNPAYIENWFFALWAYNSGFYPYNNRDSATQKGRWGVGWLNNPANNQYPANRDPFLRTTMADAEHPNRWSYPERIMGWAETPQQKGYPISTAAYAKPDYGVNGPMAGLDHVLALPDHYAFCGAVNSCSKAANGCPAVSEVCWWYGPAISADCRNDECSRESLSFPLGSAEPGVKRIYDRECETFNEWKNPQRDATKKVSVVFDLNDTGQYASGCDDVSPQNGKFTLRLGDPAGVDYSAPYAAIDLHQVGTGYKGHVWFTYLAANARNRKVVGSWIPDLDLAPGTRTRYDVVVHLPSHGADAEDAEYFVTTGAIGSTVSFCTLDLFSETQSLIPGVLGSGKWVYLGGVDMGRGAQLQLANDGVSTFSGRDSVAWDSVAFIPIGTRTGHKCGDDYEK